jgi:hypothetical protein
VFAAVETARDIRQLARQIGRAEIKAATGTNSLLWSSLDQVIRRG